MLQRVVGVVGCILLTGCAGGAASEDGACSGGDSQACTCPDGSSGTRTCREGVLGACSCNGDGGFDVSDDVPDVAPKCGDLSCNGTETCEDCPSDCGKCPKCDMAPSCTGAISVPTSSTPLESFDNKDRNLYSCGTDIAKPASATTCLDPQLRIRIRKIDVTKIGVWPGTLNMYCIVNATDGATSEVAVTPLQKDLKDGASLVFDPTVALFWGGKDLHRTINNLTITYRCYRNTDVSAYTKVFGSIKDEAVKAGGVAGPWGWAFGVGAIAAGIVEAAVGSSGGDTLRLNVQQTIDAGALLEMTNGRIWKIRQSAKAGGLDGTWDWTMELESWGCAEARPIPK